MSNFDWRSTDMRIAVVLASFISSALLRVSPASLNDDAYLYIHTADIFLEQGLQAAAAHYSWPLFSILIAFVSKLGISLVSSAFLLNSLFFALLSFSFVSIVQTIDSRKQTLIVSAIAILIFPELNDYRSMIIRDMGFWSLSCFSIWQLIIFSKSHQLRAGISFSVALILAAGFRMEALLYLLLLPALLLAAQTKQEIMATFPKLAVVIASLLFIVFLLLLSNGVNPIVQISEFASTYKPFLDHFLGLDSDQSSAIATAVFGEFAATYSQEYLWLFMTAGLLSLLIASLISGIGTPLFVFIAAWKLKVHPSIERQSLRILIGYMGINLLIVASFVLLTRFLPSRYTMVFALVALIFVVLVIGVMLGSEQLRKRGFVRYGLAFLVVYCTIGSYYSFGAQKPYIQDSISWLSEQELGSSAFLTNNHAIAYHSGRVQQYDKIVRNLSESEILAIGDNGWLVVELNSKMELLMEKLISNNQVKLERVFPETMHPKIAVYRLYEK
ncbi:MAG: hypothetical protein AB8B95_04595 [Pseudohongiellaceae bacterium]